MTSNRIAKITIDWRLIRAALNMPPDTELRNATLSTSINQGVEVVIAHPDFEEVAVGQTIPKAYPQIDLIKGALQWNWNPERKPDEQPRQQVEG